MNNNTAVAAMVLLIDSDIGRRAIPVASATDASTAYRKFVTDEGLGASEVGQGKVMNAHRNLVATIRYNGVIDLAA